MTLNAVKNGLVKYLDTEILSKVTGWQKWVAGAGFAMYIDRADNIFNSLKSNPMIKALNIIDEQTDDIDVQTLYKYFSEESKKGAVTFSMPLIGTVTLRSSDVDKLYKMITGE